MYKMKKQQFARLIYAYNNVDFLQGHYYIIGHLKCVHLICTYHRSSYFVYIYFKDFFSITEFTSGYVFVYEHCIFSDYIGLNHRLKLDSD